MRPRDPSQLGILLVSLLALSCSTLPAGPGARASLAGPSAEVFEAVADRLYFGRSVAGGGLVSDEEWARFLEHVVTPRFPDGFTVWAAQGQWRDASGAVIREPTFVLEVFRPVSRAGDAVVREIIEGYERRFDQEAVLRVQHAARVSF